jgi:uncharacterized RDD family membrane protein YckC
VKCPKCGYLGFETVDRCRNCGYDFALAAATRVPDLAMRSPEGQSEQLPDLALSAPAPAAELPLFGGGGDDDTPLITKASPPRAPLAVRRATPEVPRLRSETRPAALDLPLVGNEPPAAVAAPPASPALSPRPMAAAPAAEHRTSGHEAVPDGIEEPAAANLAARLAAALLDVAILGVIDLLVIYLTMKICGITREELSLLPKVPLGLFLIAQNLGYFIAFTAGGQTIGKMASGIKVVSDHTHRAPDLASAARRTLVWAALALPAGAGFLSTLTADRRGLHDRIADTRVVRVSA